MAKAPGGAFPTIRWQMAGGMPEARMVACVPGGWGHLLLRMQVCGWSAIVEYEQTQLFCADVADHSMRVLMLCSRAQVGQ